ncbi:MAG: phospholipid carrier-dependent glycosyltransferase [Polyangiales bacterium]
MITSPKPSWLPSSRSFWLALITLVIVGLVRSWIATRDDGLQIDEAWHTVAGVSYAQRADFRLNPEHPPLVKLWVGTALPDFKLDPFRPLDDKVGEREYIDDAYYVDNDPLAVQSRARLAMLTFHGLSLLAFAFALQRLFGPLLTLLTVALFLIDPSVAAHLPVVLTDLPLTLWASTAVLLALSAFRSWAPRDLVLAGLGLGLALVSKHSAIPVGLAVALLGVLLALHDRRERWQRRVGGVAGVLFAAYLTMWGFYGFRFDETPAVAHASDSAQHEDAAEFARDPQGKPVVFNRSMEDKIADLQSPGYRKVLQLALDVHFLPRSYLWGLADIVRAGVEGRQDVLFVYGHRFQGETPWYFFPAVLTAKLPLGFMVLIAIGAFLSARQRVPEPWQWPIVTLLGWSAIFLVAIMRGNSGYAGVRHIMPIYPTLALFGAIALALALQLRARALSAAVTLASLAMLVSALPIKRPWEYYNQLAGGADDAWLYFSDDGLENGQRAKEIAAYYDAHLRGKGQRVYDFYGLYDSEKRTYDLAIDEVKNDPDDTDTLTGTVFVNTRWMSERPLYDYGTFREAKPKARFGNLLVFEGSFRVPWLRAERRLTRVWDALSPGKRDTATAEQLLSEVMEIYPQDYQSTFELGNLRVERGARESAIEAYEQSRKHTPEGDPLVATLTTQIDALRANKPDVGPLRNPWLE